MEKNINDGGPAFPLPLGTANCSEPSESGGMSLRDYFAAAALQGLLASPKSVEKSAFNGRTVGEVFADIAYGYAEAMLEYRKKS